MSPEPKELIEVSIAKQIGRTLCSFAFQNKPGELSQETGCITRLVKAKIRPTWSRNQTITTMIRIVRIIQEPMRGSRQGLLNGPERRTDPDTGRERCFRLAEPIGIVAEPDVLLR